jgi:hypothetical protein
VFGMLGCWDVCRCALCVCSPVFVVLYVIVRCVECVLLGLCFGVLSWAMFGAVWVLLGLALGLCLSVVDSIMWCPGGLLSWVGGRTKEVGASLVPSLAEVPLAQMSSGDHELG